MSETERIGFGRRLGAYLLDFVLAGIIGSIIGMIAGAALVAIFFPSGGEESGIMALAGGFIGGFIGSIAGAYLMLLVFMLIEAFTGASPGKMILKIKIRNQDGSDAGIGKLLLRAILKNINFVSLVLLALTGLGIFQSIGSIGGLIIAIGCFFVLGAKRQAIHDMIGKTAVFKK